MADISDLAQEGNAREASDLGERVMQSDLTVYERIGSFAFDKTKKVATGVVFFGSLYTTLGINPLITSVGFMLGESIVKIKTGGTIEGRKLKNEAYLFSAVPFIPGLPLKIAYSVASIPVFIFAHAGIDHAVGKYKPSTFYNKIMTDGVPSFIRETYTESIRPRFIPDTVTTFKKPLPLAFPTAVTLNLLAPYGITGKMLGALVLSTVYRIMTASPEKEKKPNTVTNLSGGNYYTGQPAQA